MLKKVAALWCMVVLVFSVSAPGFAQGAAKEARVEGRVVRSNKDKSTLTRGEAGGRENTIDASQVKYRDYVICVGSDDDKGEFCATMISKRLSHPK
jgi:hypothetical protein